MDVTKGQSLGSDTSAMLVLIMICAKSATSSEMSQTMIHGHRYHRTSLQMPLGSTADPAHRLLECGAMDAVSVHSQLKTAISVKLALTMTFAPNATATVTTFILNMTPGTMNLTDVESGVMDVASAHSRLKIVISVKFALTMTCVQRAITIDTSSTRSMTAGSIRMWSLLAQTRNQPEFTFGLLAMDAVRDLLLASVTSATLVLIMTCVASVMNRGTCRILTTTLGRACLQPLLLLPQSS